MTIIIHVISPAESAVWTVDVILARAPARVCGLAALATGHRGRALTSARLTPSWLPTSKGARHTHKEVLRRGTVNIEPPVTDKLILQISILDLTRELILVYLREDSSIRTDERRPELLLRRKADMEHLAPLVHIGVVASGHQTPTGEVCVEVRAGEEGIVHTWLPGNGVTEPLEGVTCVTILIAVP